MKIKSAVSALSAVFLLVSGTQALADGDFLCMRADESTAITIDENGFYKYIDMRGSNGELVEPKISTDWNTYLPLRFICEQMGLQDGSDFPDGMPDGYFRYLPEEKTGYPSAVEICAGGEYYYLLTDTPFQYIDSYGNERNVSIYNVRGTLYAPMAYLAKITGAAAIWQYDTSQIMYVGNTDEIYSYIDDTNHLYRFKELQLGFDFYNNNIINSPLYLQRDGMTIANLADDVGGNPRSVTRNGFDIYYVDENDRVNVKVEGWDDLRQLEFTDTNGTPVDVYADTIVTIKNKLYGIQEANPGDGYGMLFCSDADGSNFRYLSDVPAYNLIFKRDQLDYYLFYGDASTRSSIHMIKMNTMDDYTIEITDHDRNNLLSGMRQFAVCNNHIFYIDDYSRLRVVDSPYYFDDIEIVRTEPYANRELLFASDGSLLDNVISINLDYLNDILYIVQVDETSKIYYYTPSYNRINLLDVLPNNVLSISLFSDFSYRDTFAAVTDEGIYQRKMLFNNGIISFFENGE